MTFKQDLNKLKKELKDKDIIVLNTKKDKVMFALAHILRTFARRTYCIDANYKIKENKSGIRRIEKGKVYLLNNNFTPAAQMFLKDVEYIFAGGKHG